MTEAFYIPNSRDVPPKSRSDGSKIWFYQIDTGNQERLFRHLNGHWSTKARKLKRRIPVRQAAYWLQFMAGVAAMVVAQFAIRELGLTVFGVMAALLLASLCYIPLWLLEKRLTVPLPGRYYHPPK
jgi:hypothetical protein